MWYVVEVESKNSGNWIYAKGYRSRSSAVKLAAALFQEKTRVVKYQDTYQRSADPESGKVVYANEH